MLKKISRYTIYIYLFFFSKNIKCQDYLSDSLIFNGIKHKIAIDTIIEENSFNCKIVLKVEKDKSEIVGYGNINEKEQANGVWFFYVNSNRFLRGYYKKNVRHGKWVQRCGGYIEYRRGKKVNGMNCRF